MKKIILLLPWDAFEKTFLSGWHGGFFFVIATILCFAWLVMMLSQKDPSKKWGSELKGTLEIASIFVVLVGVDVTIVGFKTNVYIGIIILFITLLSLGFIKLLCYIAWKDRPWLGCWQY